MSPKRISLLHPELELGYLSPFSDTAMLLIIPSDTSKRESGDAATKRQPWLDWRTRLGNLWRFNCPKAPAYAVEKEMGTSDDEKYDA